MMISLRLDFGEIFSLLLTGSIFRCFPYGHFEWNRYIMWKDSCHSDCWTQSDHERIQRMDDSGR